MTTVTPNKFDLSGKVVAVTGAAGVLCSGFAASLAKIGAKIALIDINLEKANEFAQGIVRNGGIAKAYFANVLDKKSLEEAYENIVADLGNVDILINGAGGNHPTATTTNEYYEDGDAARTDIKTFFNLEPEGIKRIFDLNFTGILLTTQVFTKGMVKGGGVVINISSMNAYRPLTKIPAYSAAKAAVSNLTQWLAVYFAEAGIRVNAIAPGFFSTNQNKTLLYNEDGSLTERSHKIISHTPMGRFGEVDDLTGTLYYLVDNNFSRFVTGIVVPVDGGFSAYSGV